MAACRRISERFHDRVAGDPVLKALFPKDLSRQTEHLALFLAEKLGGPPDYTAKRGKNSLLCRHAHLRIGTDEEARWLGHMFAAMEDEGFSERTRQLLRAYFAETASSLTDQLMPFYHLPLDELAALLESNPGIITSSDNRRTLLGAAALEWDVPRVKLLLEHGADVNATDPLGHDPLYHAAGAFAPGLETDGRSVVELLIQYGANVNGASGPGRLTPLHAVARRGTVAIAEALLKSGADIEARDSKGETPLRRAVNCGQERMVRVLLAHGANARSRDKRGVSPLDIARQEAIGALLRDAGAR